MSRARSTVGRRGAGVRGLGWTLVASLFVACGDGSGDETAPPAPAPEIALAPPFSASPSIAGAERCLDCHEELVESWSRTGMARTLGPVEPGELRGLGGPVPDQPAGYEYAFAEEGGIPVVVETRPDTPSHRLTAEVAFAIGSGERDRSYAVRWGSGLWFAPLEVLTRAIGEEEGRQAVLAPAHMMTSGLRLTSAITNECLGCHTDATPPPDFPLNLARAPERWQPRGISCAACHGKVDAHADWQEADLTGRTPAGDDPILRASSLSRTQKLSVCAACHLQGDARLILTADELGPPEPGGDLLDVRALFVAAEPTNEVGFVSHVERLALSACFRTSDMTCATCHDPHRTLHDEDERQRVRAACTGCHPGGTTHAAMAPACARQDTEVAPAADCAACHMPRSGTFDVAHVTIHDHFVRVDTDDAPPPSGEDELRLDEAPDGNWRRFTWPGEPAPAHVDDPGLWMMALAASGHDERALARVDAEPGPAAAMLPMYWHVRGLLLERAERVDEAIASYREALALDPTLAPSAINLGWALGRTGDVEAGLDVLNETLARFPRAHTALRNRAALRLQLGDVAGFLADLEAAFEERPLGVLASALASHWARRGDRQRAKAWSTRAHELDPVTRH